MQLTEVQQRAGTDAEFRARLTSDPHTALAEHGLTIPAQMSVDVIECTPEHLVLSLPPAVDLDATADDELSEDQLAGATGGFSPAVLVAYGVITGVVTIGSMAGSYYVAKNL
jgi:hypothetical protein